MREHLKRVVRQFLTIALIASLTAGAPSTALAAVAIKLIPVDISMAMNTYTNESTDVEVFWSDEWFTEQPSTEYNHDLAVTSIVLSSTAYVMGPGVHSNSDMRRALLNFGFDEGETVYCNYDYPYTADDCDVVAYTVASKDIGDEVLIAVIIRGTLNDYEWDSDVRVSATSAGYNDSVEHYAFYQAEGKLMNGLAEYITELAKEDEAAAAGNIVFYVTGHSRGGSVADILASELTDIYGKDRVYAYTFGAPAVAVRAAEAGYENIFNILSADDQVSALPFTKLDFKRFGVDKIIASSGEYESQNDESFMAHDPYVYYARLKSGLPDTLFE